MNSKDKYSEQRKKMVESQIIRRGIKDMRVLEAMNDVPRHEFVEENLRNSAYGDHPLSIGFDQTISQPYIVALMVELLELKGREKVLEIGTGCGYQTAILAQLCEEVFTVEIVEPLANSAQERLNRLGYDNIRVLYGDGYYGFNEAAPFDAIIISAAPRKIPKPLLDQLAEGGRMVIPLGTGTQSLKVIEKTKKGIVETTNIAVRFVPMTGKAEN